MPALTVNGETYAEEIENVEGKVLVDIWGNNCAPCQTMSPIIDELADELDDVKVVKVNFEEATDVAVRLKVMGIPSFYYYKNGEIIKQHTGQISKAELKSWFTED